MSYSIWVPGHHGGESETIIGKWLAKGGARDKILIATKVGMDMQAGGKGLSKSHILASVEASLRRLKTDYIDLYQAHADDVSVPLKETLEAFASLIAAGKVRAIGASNYEAPRLAEALAVSKAKGLPRYVSLQPHYNLANRALFEGALQDLCVAEGLGVIPYYALASGFLTGKYRSTDDLAGRARARGVGQYLNPRGLELLTEIDKIAADLRSDAGANLARLAPRPAWHHRADRQRDEPGAARRNPRRDEDRARCRSARASRQGERVSAGNERIWLPRRWRHLPIRSPRGGRHE